MGLEGPLGTDNELVRRVKGNIVSEIAMEPGRPRPVGLSEALDELRGDIERCAETAVMLEKRIESVLVPDEAKPSIQQDLVPVPADLSVMVGHVRTLSQKVTHITNLLQYTSSRVNL